MTQTDFTVTIRMNVTAATHEEAAAIVIGSLQKHPPPDVSVIVNGAPLSRHITRGQWEQTR